jgi:Clp amino terminal domain, pathogenicity island component
MLTGRSAGRHEARKSRISRFFDDRCEMREWSDTRPVSEWRVAQVTKNRTCPAFLAPRTIGRETRSTVRARATCHLWFLGMMTGDAWLAGFAIPNDDAWEFLMDLLLSDRSQHVMGLARDEALNLRHEYIGTEHVLLGIVSDSADVTAGALGSFNITLARARSGVETMIGLGPPSASPDDRGVTPRAQKAIEFAREEAAQRNSPRVEPEHLLLGVAREVHGVAAQVLCDLQAPPDAVRAKVSELLGRGN